MKLINDISSQSFNISCLTVLCLASFSFTSPPHLIFISSSCHLSPILPFLSSPLPPVLAFSLPSSFYPSSPCPHLCFPATLPLFCFCLPSSTPLVILSPFSSSYSSTILFLLSSSPLVFSCMSSPLFHSFFYLLSSSSFYFTCCPSCPHLSLLLLMSSFLFDFCLPSASYPLLPTPPLSSPLFK